MKGGKLFVLLESLSPAEFKELKKVVTSPIYNTNERMLTLYSALKKSYPHFDSSSKGKEKLFISVFPGEVYSNHKIHRLMTDMTKVVEEYLFLLDQRKDKLNALQHMLPIYQKRKLNRHFKQCAEKIEALLHQIAPSYRDTDYYLHALKLNHALYFHPTSNKYDLQDNTLDQAVNHLDHYFSLARMRYSLEMKNRRRIINKVENTRFMESLNLEATQGFMQESLLFQLYQMAFGLVEEKEASNFEQYEQLVFEHIQHFPQDTDFLFFTGLNYCIWQLNKGDNSFNLKVLNWYKLGLTSDLLIKNGVLSERTFGNIVVVALKEKEYSWVKSFIDTHLQYLKSSKQEDINLYYKGLQHFYQQEFKQAYRVLLNYPFTKTYYLRSRLTAIRAIFEEYILGRHDFDFIMTQILAYEKALSRNKLFSASRKEPHLNFLSLLKKIIRLRQQQKFDEKIRKQLILEVSTAKRISVKNWLLEKIQTL